MTRAQRVSEFCQTFQICQATFWKYVALEEIRVIRIGRRVLVPGPEIDRIVAEGIKRPKKAA